MNMTVILCVDKFKVSAVEEKTNIKLQYLKWREQ